MNSGFTRLNIELSEAPATIEAFNKIQQGIVDAAIWSYASEDEFEVAYHENKTAFSVTVEYDRDGELSLIQAGWLLGGIQARIEDGSFIKSASFWISTHDEKDNTIESVV